MVCGKWQIPTSEIDHFLGYGMQKGIDKNRGNFFPSFVVRYPWLITFLVAHPRKWALSGIRYKECEHFWALSGVWYTESDHFPGYGMRKVNQNCWMSPRNCGRNKTNILWGEPRAWWLLIHEKNWILKSPSTFPLIQSSTKMNPVSSCLLL